MLAISHWGLAFNTDKVCLLTINKNDQDKLKLEVNLDTARNKLSQLDTD